jgi:hypothetical protein
MPRFFRPVRAISVLTSNPQSESRFEKAFLAQSDDLRVAVLQPERESGLTSFEAWLTNDPATYCARRPER